MIVRVDLRATLSQAQDLAALWAESMYQQEPVGYKGRTVRLYEDGVQYFVTNEGRHVETAYHWNERGY